MKELLSRSGGSYQHKLSVEIDNQEAEHDKAKEQTTKEEHLSVKQNQTKKTNSVILIRKL